MNKMKASVILSTHNRLRLLEKSIISLINQDVDKECFEIVVIDSNSSISAESLINWIKDTYDQVEISYVFNDINGGYTSSKHIGINLANNEIIIFADDDSESDPGLVRAVIETFSKNSEVGCMGGKILPKYGSTTVPSFIESLWTTNQYGRYLQDFTCLDFGEHVKEIPWGFVWTTNMAFRKDVFNQTNGFGPDGFGKQFLYANGGGESFFVKQIEKMGLKIIYNPKMLVHHRIEPYRMELPYFKARYFYYGVGFSFDKIRQKNVTDNRLILLLRGVKHHLKALYFFCRNKKMRYVQILYSWRGFKYHQNSIRNNPTLLDYVLRKSWIGYDWSKLKPDKLFQNPVLW